MHSSPKVINRPTEIDARVECTMPTQVGYGRAGKDIV